jgi:hypothetical protein
MMRRIYAEYTTQSELSFAATLQPVEPRKQVDFEGIVIGKSVCVYLGSSIGDAPKKMDRVPAVKCASTHLVHIEYIASLHSLIYTIPYEAMGQSGCLIEIL